MSKLTVDDNYQVFGWMVDELNLDGAELVAYAIIYKYSCNPEVGCYYGSQQYICDWTKKTKPTVQKALNTLTERQLILKEEIWKNNVKFCQYTINREIGYLKNLNTQIIPDNIEKLFDEYTENDDLYNALLDFAEYRKDKKNPLTEKAAKMLLNKLNKCTTDADKIDCLQTSIMNGWTGVFPDNYSNKATKKAPYQTDAELKMSHDTKGRRRK